MKKLKLQRNKRIKYALILPYVSLKNGLLVTLLSFFIACQQQTQYENTPWEGPLVTTFKSTVLVSDSAKVSLRIIGQQVNQYKNQDTTYPKGFFMENFENNKVICELKADSAYYSNAKREYIAVGNVVMKNFKEKLTLKTQKLVWDKKRKKIFTDQKVKIYQDYQVINGKGLEADQNLKKWKITKVSGIIPMEEDHD